jgi:metal-responsive CopG/Arc/MetJ family transcriptional regulator
MPRKGEASPRLGKGRNKADWPQTTIYLQKDLSEWLDQHAPQVGEVSRTALIRRILRDYREKYERLKKREEL